MSVCEIKTVQDRTAVSLRPTPNTPLAPTPCSYHILENVSIYIQH